MNEQRKRRNTEDGTQAVDEKRVVGSEGCGDVGGNGGVGARPLRKQEIAAEDEPGLLAPQKPDLPAKRKGPGRPSALTPSAKSRIMSAVRCGASYKMAAVAAGVAESTFYRWKSMGEIPSAPVEFREFLAELKQAEEEGHVSRLAQIQKAAGKDWKAGAWILERRLPQLYSVRYQLETSGSVDFNLFGPVGLRDAEEPAAFADPADLILEPPTEE